MSYINLALLALWLLLSSGQGHAAARIPARIAKTPQFFFAGSFGAL